MRFKSFSVFFLLLCSARLGSTGYARESLQLSLSTFKKIIPHFDVSIVKVDKHYPHGRNQTQFEKFVGLLSQDKRTIVAEIGVQEFGGKENMDLAHLLGVPKKDSWPALFIFTRNTDSWIAKYQGYFSLNRLRNFVNQHADVEWSCSSCILELDKLVKAYVFDRSLLASEMNHAAQEFIANLSPDDPALHIGKYYLKLMEKIEHLGQPAVAMESERVVRLLQVKLPPLKKKLLKQHVDILYYSFGGNLWSFQEEEIDYDPEKQQKDEL